MKKILRLTMMSLGVLSMGLLSSCALENDPAYKNSNSLLVKAPKVIAYSGDTQFGTGAATRANAGDGYIGNQNWANKGAESLENITDAERLAVLEAIKAKVTGEKISEDLVFPWTEYFLQDVISGQDGRFTNAGSNNTPSSSYSMEAWNTGADCRAQNPWYSDNHTTDYRNYEVVTNSAHLNNYFQRQNSDGSQTRINETTLMTDMTVGTYEEMKGKQFRWYINCHENLHWSEYIIVVVDGSYYICFDFACGHKENDVDGNPGRGCTVNDWDYNDWILKITPAGNQPDVWGEPEEEPQQPETPKCDKCGHPEHGDDCDECEPGDPCKPAPEPETPTCDKCGHPEHGDECDECEPGDPCNPDVDVEEPAATPGHKHTNEVEVNLSADDKNGEYLESHLSIHVRAATDVEIFIPIPKQYYCEADDMAIVMKHENNHMWHSDDTYSFTHKLKDSDLAVTITIAYEEDGIRITTDGITQEVIDWCAAKCHGDGITFEIWNYFDNEVIDLETLKQYLNQATIKFLDSEPDSYINAFNKNEAGEIFEDDCTVSIVDEQVNDYEDPVTGKHLNGSPYNEIYEKKGK